MHNTDMSETEKNKENKNEPEKKQIVKLSADRGSRSKRQAKPSDEMSSFDIKLAKEEAAAKEANVIAFRDPELKGKTKLQARATEISMALH